MEDMKNYHVFILLGIVLGAWISGCAASLKPEGSVRVWTSRPDAALSDLASSISGLKAEFPAERGSWITQLRDPVQHPDLILADLSTELIMAQRDGLFLNLEDLIPRTSSWESFPAGLKTPYFRSSLPWFFPANLQSWVLFYNTKVLEKAGISSPRTVDELEVAFENLRKADITPLSLGSSFGWPALALASILDLRLNGKEKYSAFLSGTRKPDSQDITPVLSRLEEWKIKGWIDSESGLYNWPEAALKLKEGKAGFFFHLASGANRFTPGDGVAVMRFPSADGKDPDSELAAFQGWVISSLAKHPEAGLNLADLYLKTGMSASLGGTQRTSVIPNTITNGSEPILASLQKDMLRGGVHFLPTPDRILPAQQAYNVNQVFIRYFSPGNTSAAQEIQSLYFDALKEN